MHQKPFVGRALPGPTGGTHNPASRPSGFVGGDLRTWSEHKEKEGNGGRKGERGEGKGQCYISALIFIASSAKINKIIQR